MILCLFVYLLLLVCFVFSIFLFLRTLQEYPLGDSSYAPANEKTLLPKLVSRPSHQGEMRTHFISAPPKTSEFPGCFRIVNKKREILMVKTSKHLVAIGESSFEEHKETQCF